MDSVEITPEPGDLRPFVAALADLLVADLLRNQLPDPPTED